MRDMWATDKVQTKLSLSPIMNYVMHLKKVLVCSFIQMTSIKLLLPL